MPAPLQTRGSRRSEGETWLASLLELSRALAACSKAAEPAAAGDRP